MSDLVHNTNFRFMGQGCKIDQYGLQDFVWRLYLEGKGYCEIARRCNTELASRPGRKKYFDISHCNVWLYCATVKRHLNTKSGLNIQERVKQVVNIVTEMAETIDRTKKQLDAQGYSKNGAKEFALSLSKG